MEAGRVQRLMMTSTSCENLIYRTSDGHRQRVWGGRGGRVSEETNQTRFCWPHVVVGVRRALGGWVGVWGWGWVSARGGGWVAHVAWHWTHVWDERCHVDLLQVSEQYGLGDLLASEELQRVAERGLDLQGRGGGRGILGE